MSEEIVPFRIDVDDRDLADLRERLARTRWPRQLPGEGWQRGVPVDYLRELAEYWRDGYDWRAQEAALNKFPQFTTEIDGLDVHFLHVRSAAPDALPLILTHGWPNSFVEFSRLIGRLTEDFHVVVPSVPGFGFSQAPASTGFTVARVGRMWAELMRRLGYSRYGAQGGDLGAYVTPEVAKAAPEHVVGVYVHSGLGLSDEVELEFAGPVVNHHDLLRAAPQTFSYGWQDSPVGLLAWLMQKFGEFSFTVDTPDQAIDRDLLLTNASVYWFTGTSGTSSWLMYDSTHFAWPVGQNLVPTGLYSGPPGVRSVAERHNKIIHWPTDAVSGHFCAMEVPDVLARDVRTFFAMVRQMECAAGDNGDHGGTRSAVD
jgi:pimeloyl-ACP methyl ester carboxylesterase